MNRETIILKKLKEGATLNQYYTTKFGIKTTIGGKEFCTYTTRLGSAICNLRKKGYPIITHRVAPTNYAVYYLPENWEELMVKE